MMGSNRTESVPVTHIIFDMDGLLLDSERLYGVGMSRVCKMYGSEFTEEANALFYGRQLEDSAEEIVKLCNLPITKETFLDLLDKELEKEFRDVEWMPGAQRLLKHFHENNIPMALATGSTRVNYERKIKRFTHLFTMFHHIVLGPEDPQVQNGKPAPDIFQVASKRFDELIGNNKQVLVFEDSIPGVEAGLAAGMQIVWVPELSMSSKRKFNENVMQLTSLEEFQPELFHLPSF